MRIWKHVAIYLVLLLIIGAIFSAFNLTTGKPEEISIGTFVERINKGEVKSVDVRDSHLDITFTDDKKATTQKESGEPLSQLLSNYGIAPEKIQAINVTVH